MLELFRWTTHVESKVGMSYAQPQKYMYGLGLQYFLVTGDLLLFATQKANFKKQHKASYGFFNWECINSGMDYWNGGLLE